MIMVKNCKIFISEFCIDKDLSYVKVIVLDYHVNMKGAQL